MSRVFGFDIGTTSIGFAVIDHDPEAEKGRILRLGVRIFPETRDPKAHAPLNQDRRQARLRRRQLRRRRERLQSLYRLLSEAGLLPTRHSQEWQTLMKSDPYDLRARAVGEDALTPYEVGRALYHLAKRRHFRGRDLDDDSPRNNEEDADEKQARAGRDETLAELRKRDLHLGAWLAERDPRWERRRGVHAIRQVVEAEFDQICNQQVALGGSALKDSIREAIFTQRPVFWRRNTLGACPFFPDKPLCPKGAWLSQQRRMLEKVNNLEIAGGNGRPLDEEERREIVNRLQTQASMSWGGVRKALAPLYRSRHEPGEEKRMKFNLEVGGDRHLLGNAVEARLANVFGEDWREHPRKQDLRDAIHKRLWCADYRDVGQRIVILPADKRKENRALAARSFVDDFGATEEQAATLAGLSLPTGWEPYSTEALHAMLPHLESGVRFGALLSGPKLEDWRNKTFPNRDRPTGEVLDRLPSPADKEEQRRISRLRNPTVARTQNELRKVVNNLIEMFGKPDLISVELAREVGKSKREREEMTKGIGAHQRRREDARNALIERGIEEPSRWQEDKWMLWEESGRRCPYTGDCISFDALFRTGEFEVEHIRPRSRSLDDSFGNKTLCRRDENLRKGDRTPYEYLHSDIQRWATIKERLDKMRRGGTGKGKMPLGKIKRFISSDLPDDFAARQLNDTGFAAREAVAFLKRLWPNQGPAAPVTVQAVAGRVTAHLRRLWGLNNILASDGEKNRADHRHHAIDALTAACAGAHPGMTQKLSRYWQQQKENNTERPHLPPPWETIRDDATKAVEGIIVSHRVRKKVSGALHRETHYGRVKRGEEHVFVTRKPLRSLSKTELTKIYDKRVREVVQRWVEEQGGDPKKARPPYPKIGRKGPEIRKVRLEVPRQPHFMKEVAAGYIDSSNSNHHIAIFRLPDGKIDFKAVTLFEASGRLARKEPIVQRRRDDGATFVMSLSQGDALIPGDDGDAVKIVESVWADGRAVVVDHTDATGHTKRYRRVKAIVENGWKKVSIDPIGRIRVAND